MEQAQNYMENNKHVVEQKVYDIGVHFKKERIEQEHYNSNYSE